MPENTILCCVCGSELPANQTICSKCGCPAIKKHTVTFKKVKGSYLESALFVITLYNEQDSARIAIDNTAEQSVAIRPGIYNIEMLCGLLKLNTKLNITKDSTFDVGIKLGFFKNQLFIN